MEKMNMIKKMSKDQLIDTMQECEEVIRQNNQYIIACTAMLNRLGQTYNEWRSNSLKIDYSYTGFGWDLIAKCEPIMRCLFDMYLNRGDIVDITSIQIFIENNNEYSYDNAKGIRVPNDLGQRVLDACQKHNLGSIRYPGD